MVTGLLIVLIFLNIALIFLFLAKQKTSDTKNMESQLSALEKGVERTDRIIREEISKNREELNKNFMSFQEMLINQLSKMTDANEQRLEKVREVVYEQLKNIQEDNGLKLEKMRETVDEKLHSTLEKRLGESFKVVSDRLEKVHQGLGEMQTLASGVGDLKRVLTNVKTRGTWGEMQLEILLEQILTAQQYDKNVITKSGSNDPVEFAIKLPGKEDKVVYIPIDAKFPKEDYERLINAQEIGDVDLVEKSAKAIEARIKLEAKTIRDKYVDPPNTTDFAIMYLPFEGLYAEVIRRPGLADFLQREYRISIAGPTTFTALLNSLQMGFRTLAVEKRASEVWTVLGVIKTEFGKFGDLLGKTKDKLKQASNSIEVAERKSRTIERKLKKVQELPTKNVELIDQLELELPLDQLSDEPANT